MKTEEQFGEFLRKHIEPVGEQGPARDLWRDMEGRLHESRHPVPWFDWALAALAAVLCVITPDVVPALLYHL